MPPIRDHPKSKKKPRSQWTGERFQSALGLTEKPQIFSEMKKAFRRIAVDILDVALPTSQQKPELALFVEKSISAFPGFFNARHANNDDRLRNLELYLRSHLDKKRDKLHKKQQTAKPRSTSSSSSSSAPPPTPPKIKVVRRRAVSPPPEEDDEQEQEQEQEQEDGYDDSAPPSYTPPPPPHHPNPNSNFTPSPISSLTPNPSPSPDPTAPADVAAFLASCQPPMGHLLPALRIAGVTTTVHLHGMARWSDDRLRQFLRAADIARTPLEEEALVIGFTVEFFE